MRKKKKDDGVKMVLPGWMASYADMFTVLMAFFVLLFAMSNIEQELFQQFIVSFNPRAAERFDLFDGGGGIHADAGAGIVPEVVPPDPAGAYGDEGGIGDDIPEGLGGLEPQGDAVGDLMNTFMTFTAQHIPTTGEDGGPIIGVTPEDDSIRINIQEIVGEGVLFNSGQARLTPYARQALDLLGPLLQELSATNHGILIEGHTDDRPINTAAFPSNWSLSGARAMAVVEHLVTYWDIPPDMIVGHGRGEHVPIAPNDTEEGRALNRRVEIVVFTGGATEDGPVARWFRIPGID